MWKLKIAEGGSPWLRSTNDHVGRQVWEFDPTLGSLEELADIEKVRQTFHENRFEKKHSSDLLMHSQLKHKKGLWSPDEDQKLRDYIINHGLGCWSSVPIHAGLQRNGKSCRLRWINYLRPGLKRGTFTSQEEEIIFSLHDMLGNKWSQMSQHLPGRTDYEIKNHWHSYLKKKVENSENMKSQAICLNTQNKQSTSSSNYTRKDSSLESSEADGCSNLPKILFADWLSLEQIHKFDTSGADTRVVNI